MQKYVHQEVKVINVIDPMVQLVTREFSGRQVD